MFILLCLLLLWALITKRVTPLEGFGYGLLLCCLVGLSILISLWEQAHLAEDGPARCWDVECLASLPERNDHLLGSTRGWA